METIGNSLNDYVRRRTGKSTRLADAYIQKIFSNKGPVTIRDHSGTSQADLYLFHIIKRRLDIEHGLKFKYNESELKIELENK